MNTLKIAFASMLLFACGATNAAADVAQTLKRTVVVGGFENRSYDGDTEIAERLADQLSDALVRAGAFVVVEPESEAAQTSMYDVDPSSPADGLAAQPVRRTQVLAAQFAIKGTVTDFNMQAAGSTNGFGVGGVRLGAIKSVAHIGLIVRVIDGTTQQVLASRRVEGKVTSKKTRLDVDIEGYNYENETFRESPLGQAGQMAIDNAVAAIAEETRKVPYAARVLKVADDGRAIISCGALSGIAQGMEFLVMSVGDELQDPATGEILGFDQQELGVVSVTRVLDRFAFVDALEGIKVGDVVRLR